MNGFVISEKHILHDYDHVNGLIIRREKPNIDGTTTLLNKALYNNYLYELIVIELIHKLTSERNTHVRSEIKKLIMDNNEHEIKSIVSKADFINIKNEFILYAKHKNKDKLINNILDAVYQFDYKTMDELNELPKSQVKEKIFEILKDSIVVPDLSNGIKIKNTKFSNILTQCNNGSANVNGDVCDNSYCHDGRLIMENIDDYNEYVDIIAQNIKYIIFMSKNDIINYFDFENHLNEKIQIYKI
jgi:transcription elongation factor Elf1